MPTTRSHVIRVVASSLCFDQDPPPIKRLDQARAAAADITQALADSGVIELIETTNGADEFTPKAEPPLPLQVS